MPTSEQLNDLRKRVLAGEQYTETELAQAIRALIADRASAFDAPAKKTGKSKSTSVNLDELL